MQMFYLGKLTFTCGFLSYRNSKVNSFKTWRKSKFNTFKIIAANINEHETSSGVVSFEDMNSFQSTTENNSANDLSFSKDEEDRVNIYYLQGTIDNS